MWNWLANLYQTNPKFHAFVAAAEGGAFMGFLMATGNGIDLSKKGLMVLGSAIAGGAVTAVRNRFTTPPEKGV